MNPIDHLAIVELKVYEISELANHAGNIVRMRFAVNGLSMDEWERPR